MRIAIEKANITNKQTHTQAILDIIGEVALPIIKDAWHFPI